MEQQRGGGIVTQMCGYRAGIRTASVIPKKRGCSGNQIYIVDTVLCTRVLVYLARAQAVERVFTQIKRQRLLLARPMENGCVFEKKDKKKK